MPAPRRFCSRTSGAAAAATGGAITARAAFQVAKDSEGLKAVGWAYLDRGLLREASAAFQAAGHCEGLKAVGLAHLERGCTDAAREAFRAAAGMSLISPNVVEQ